MRFHRRCGDRVTLLNDNSTAIRNFVEFNHGIILSAEPLKDDVIFEVCIDRKVNVWNGSLEIGVTTLDPEFMELPATATKLRNTAWIMSGSSIVKDGASMVNSYGPELDTLQEGDCVGVLRTSKAELMFYLNSRCLGVAARDMPPRLFAVIDLYGQCVQVSIIHHHDIRQIMDCSLEQIEEDPNNDDTLTSSEIESMPSVSFPKEIYVPMTSEGACALVAQDRLRFHPRCGILVKLSNNNKTAERARPLDDYNNGVVMTHRPLYDNELFEIRIIRLVDKWSGSIEVGVTSHNPATIRFPSTMTNMDSGTIMMSGCKVLLNGHGTCMEYGTFNLDELREGDTVGMVKKGNGKLHYYINGVDQGVATDKVELQVWGVIDLYGMTVKVSIVDPCEDQDASVSNMPMIMCTPDLHAPSITFRQEIHEDTLLFHTLRDSNVIIINDSKTAHRPNAFEFFNNGIVMTNRCLRNNELFQVRLDLVITKWAGSIEIGVTQHTCNDIQLPFRMSNAKSGTWAMTGEDVIRDGSIVIPQYVRNLNRLVEGDTVGVMRRGNILHFFVNGIDQGPAAFNIPDNVYGVVDLYGRVAQATIVDTYSPPQVYSPESPLSSESNATIYPEMCFHRVHGRNARLSRSRLTASRATVYSEFNHAVLFSSRPLRECDMFELRIDKMVDCWIGSLEIGVTAIRPEDLEANGGVGMMAGTATDLNWDTYILSGAAMMKDGECVRSGYPLDLDKLTVGSRVGMMWHADRSLHYYLDGMDMGKAWYVPHLNIYAVVDLYGQCTQVTILQNEERAFNYNGCTNSDNSLLSNSRALSSPPPPYWSFSEYCGNNICLMDDYSIARRISREPIHTLVFSSAHLALEEIFEIKVTESKFGYAGSFRMGVTDINILNVHVNRTLPPSVACLPHYTAFIDGKYMKYSIPGQKDHEVYSFSPSFEWLRPSDRVGLKKTSDSKVLIYFNSEQTEMAFENVPDKVYVVMEICGSVSQIHAVSRVINAANNQGNVGSDDFNKYLTSPDENCHQFSNDIIDQSFNNGLEEFNNGMDDFTNGMEEFNNGMEDFNEVTTPDEAKNITEITNDEIEQDMIEFAEQQTDVEPIPPTEGSLVTSPIPDTALEEVPTTVDPNENEEETTAALVTTEPKRKRQPLPYTFHYIHGKNLKLCSSDTVAMKTKGFNNGVAVVSQPLRRGNNFRFRVDKLSGEWSGSVCIGAVGALPVEEPAPCGLNLTPPLWALTSDILVNDDTFMHSQMGAALDELAEHSVLTIQLRFNSDLVVDLDGKVLGIIGVVPLSLSHVYPMIDLYGRVQQISILLHPYVMACGVSLDLPIITENHREESLAELELSENEVVEDSEPSKLAKFNQKKKAYSQDNLIKEQLEPIVFKPGPSAESDLAPEDDSAQKDIKPTTLPDRMSLHYSLIVSRQVALPTEKNETANRSIRKSQSTHSFWQSHDDLFIKEKDGLRHTFSAGSKIGEDSARARQQFCDTNIRHNDRYPEAGDVDNLDHEIVDAMTLETGNLPDLTEEQSSSLDESTRRDDMWSETLSVDNLNYLNRLLCFECDGVDGLSLEAEWEASGGRCEHLRLVLKFWSYLILPLPELKQAVSWRQVHCYCHNCQPDAPDLFAGWVRIERIAGCVERGWWHVSRSMLCAAKAASTGQDGEATQRATPSPPSPPSPTSHPPSTPPSPPPQVASLTRPPTVAEAPNTSPLNPDIWFDEEGKPHHTVLAIEIDIEGAEAECDRLMAFLIYLRPHLICAEDNTSSIDD